MSTHPNRRHSDRFESEPRATYAPNTIIDQCQLVRVGSLAHEYMVAMKWEQLDAQDGAALMQPPVGWIPEELA